MIIYSKQSCKVILSDSLYEEGGCFMEQNNGTATAATVLGIVSLVFAFVGSITFGVIGSGIAIVTGIIALVFGISVKKQTNGSMGSAGFICGLLGVIFGAVFMLMTIVITWIRISMV